MTALETSSALRRFALIFSGAAGLVLAAWGVAEVRALAGESALTGPSAGTGMGEASPTSTLVVPDSFRGRSGAVRFRTLTGAEAIRMPGFITTFGEPAIRTPDVYRGAPPGDSAFALLVLRPFGEKRGEMLNGYRLGRWPAERWLMSRNYYNPDGFVEVTQANQSLRLSARFTLGDFVTHDQRGIWPKYVALEESLIDKLELVLQEIERRGLIARGVVVLSGFRAPYYNDRGAGEGMARASRHMYGDAADIVIDSDGDRKMDDLNRDGRVTLEDTRPIAQAITAVEARFPELRGGLGVYAATGPSGPFVHIDVRGISARWESGWWKRGTQ